MKGSRARTDPNTPVQSSVLTLEWMDPFVGSAQPGLSSALPIYGQNRFVFHGHLLQGSSEVTYLGTNLSEIPPIKTSPMLVHGSTVPTRTADLGAVENPRPYREAPRGGF